MSVATTTATTTPSTTSTSTASPALELDDVALAVAAEALSDAFGLGEETEVGSSWPVDDGDRVLAAPVTGGATGVVLLGVNAVVAGRLLSDPARVRAGFQRALDAVGSFEVEVGEVEVVEDRRPARSVEIRDAERTTALFGVVGDDGSDADGAGADVAADADLIEAEVLSHRSSARSASTGGAGDDILLDVEVELAVELGRLRMPMREVLELRPGHVIEFGRSADAPVDVMVNGRQIGWAEVVVVGEQFGVRMVDRPDDAAR